MALDGPSSSIGNQQRDVRSVVRRVRDSRTTRNERTPSPSPSRRATRTRPTSTTRPHLRIERRGFRRSHRSRASDTAHEGHVRDPRGARASVRMAFRSDRSRGKRRPVARARGRARRRGFERHHRTRPGGRQHHRGVARDVLRRGPRRSRRRRRFWRGASATYSPLPARSPRDTTRDVLWRLRNGGFPTPKRREAGGGSSPAYAVVLIGTNDLSRSIFARRSSRETAPRGNGFSLKKKPSPACVSDDDVASLERRASRRRWLGLSRWSRRARARARDEDRGAGHHAPRRARRKHQGVLRATERLVGGD